MLQILQYDNDDDDDNDGDDGNDDDDFDDDKARCCKFTVRQ